MNEKPLLGFGIIANLFTVSAVQANSPVWDGDPSIEGCIKCRKDSNHSQVLLSSLHSNIPCSVSDMQCTYVYTPNMSLLSMCMLSGVLWINC